MTRVFIATLGTETNTFASFPTGLEEFKDVWSETGIADAGRSGGSAAALHWLERAQDLGWEVAEGLHARARPSGTTSRSAYEFMRDRILSDLKAAGKVDAVLLSLHGAMVADGYDDCEGDLTARVRKIVGEGVPIGLELDLHAHIDDTLIDAADIIVFYKTYPHIDQVERAAEVFTLIQRTLEGKIKPVMALFDCKVMGLFPVTRPGPMQGFVDAMTEAEGKDGILSLSLNHGFPWADVPLAGAKMLAIADGDIEVAQKAAREFGLRFYRDRDEAALPFTPFEDAIAEATRRGDKPLLLADTSDQIGSGAPGDTVHVLRALIDAGVRNAAIVPIWDPLAVGLCFNAGVGAKMKLRIGGKFEPQSGPCLDADVEILFLKRDARQEQQAGVGSIAIGDIAVVRVEGIEVLLSTHRMNVFMPSVFTDHGITIEDKQVISIKNLFKQTDVFAPLVRDQLYVATPGASNPDWSALPFKRLPRPIWPLDTDPLGIET